MRTPLRHCWTCLLLVTLAYGGGFGGASLARATESLAAVVAPTRIHIATPFLSNGHPKPDLMLQQISGPCVPTSYSLLSRARISWMNTYSCFLPANVSYTHPSPKGKSVYNCLHICATGEPCWRLRPPNERTMICLLQPLDLNSAFKGPWGLEGLRVHVTNRPGPSVGRPSPLDAAPWIYELSDGVMCDAQAPDRRFPHRNPPVLIYACSSLSVLPRGPIDRSQPMWTVHAARSIEEANKGHYPLRLDISNAWFIGNGPR